MFSNEDVYLLDLCFFGTMSDRTKYLFKKDSTFRRYKNIYKLYRRHRMYDITEIQTPYKLSGIIPTYKGVDFAFRDTTSYTNYLYNQQKYIEHTDFVTEIFTFIQEDIENLTDVELNVILEFLQIDREVNIEPLKNQGDYKKNLRGYILLKANSTKILGKMGDRVATKRLIVGKDTFISIVTDNKDWYFKFKVEDASIQNSFRLFNKIETYRDSFCAYSSYGCIVLVINGELLYTEKGIEPVTNIATRRRFLLDKDVEIDHYIRG